MHLSGKLKRFVLAIMFALAAVVSLVTPQAALAMKFFVANALGEVKPEEKVKVEKPKPVQVIFEFQRDGKPNARATKVVSPWAMEDIKNTGNFSEVGTAPVPDGALLSIKFNNVIIKEEIDKAKKQAFGAGLGFGLFGGVVATDHYEVTLEYIPATGAAPIRTEVKHEFYAKYGKKDVEIPGTEYPKMDDAIKVLVRQALDRGVNNIFTDPAFPR